VVEWTRELSKGEQQRLVFARLFYHRPMFALLDESTSALDHGWEKTVHELCHAFNITLVSVGHRKSLYNYHERILQLSLDGSWKIIKSKPVISKATQFIQSVDQQKQAYAPIIPERLYHVPSIPPKNKAAQAKSAVDVDFFKRMWKIVNLAQSKWFALNVALLFAIVVMGFIYMGLNLAAAEFGERVILATEHADKGEVTLWISLTIGVLLTSTFMLSGSTFFAGYIAWDWRTSLTKLAHKSYMTDTLVYYNLQIDKTIDNPDQRIASDLRSYLVGLGTDNPWARGLLMVFRNGITALVLIVGYSVYTFFSIGFLPPLFLLVYNVVAYVPTHLLLKRLSSIIYEREKQEGEFRFLQAHIREHAEAIAFYRANDKTLQQSRETFKSLLKAQWTTAVRKFQLNFVSQSLAVMNDAIAPLAIVLSAQWGIWDISTLTAAQIFAEYSTMISLLHKTSDAMLAFFELMPSLAGLAGSGMRVSEFFEICDRLSDDRIKGAGIYKSNYGTIKSGNVIKMESVSASTPEGLRVVEGLDLELGRGDNLLIMGPSGCGKSSLFRILKGLWPLQHGTITTPNDLGYRGIFFLSQSPYFVSGTLRDQIIYPHKRDQCQEDDGILQSYLEQVGVGYLTSRNPQGFDHEELNWENILSGGEQQRLVMTRLLYHKPMFAAMDESTSAVDQKMEKMLYKMCHTAGVTTFSVGHRDNLIPLHRFLLRIGNKDGSHQLINTARGPQSTVQTFQVEDL